MSILRTTNSAVLVGLFVAGIGAAQEKRIKRSELPPPVEKTVPDVSKGATVKGLLEETEKGKTLTKWKIVVNGHRKDVEVDLGGAVVEVEEEAAMGSLPASVKAELTAKAAGGQNPESRIHDEERQACRLRSQGGDCRQEI